MAKIIQITSAKSHKKYEHFKLKVRKTVLYLSLLLNILTVLGLAYQNGYLNHIIELINKYN